MHICFTYMFIFVKVILILFEIKVEYEDSFWHRCTRWKVNVRNGLFSWLNIQSLRVKWRDVQFASVYIWKGRNRNVCLNKLQSYMSESSSSSSIFESSCHSPCPSIIPDTTESGRTSPSLEKIFSLFCGDSGLEGSVRVGKDQLWDNSKKGTVTISWS